MPPKFYTLFLESEDHFEVRIIEEDVWNWIFSHIEFPHQVSKMPDPAIPPSVMDKIKKSLSPYLSSEIDMIPTITISNVVNDRALGAPSLHTFSNKRQYKNWLKDHDLKPVLVYEGEYY